MKRAAKHLKEDFYVDNMLSGAEAAKGAKILIQQMVELLGLGSSNLWKCTSKHLRLLDGMTL